MIHLEVKTSMKAHGTGKVSKAFWRTWWHLWLKGQNFRVYWPIQTENERNSVFTEKYLIPYFYPVSCLAVSSTQPSPTWKPFSRPWSFCPPEMKENISNEIKNLKILITIHFVSVIWAPWNKATKYQFRYKVQILKTGILVARILVIWDQTLLREMSPNFSCFKHSMSSKPFQLFQTPYFD